MTVTSINKALALHALSHLIFTSISEKGTIIHPIFSNEETEV